MENFNSIPTERLEYIRAQALAMERWHLALYNREHDDEDRWIASFYAGRAALYKEEIIRRMEAA